MSSEEKTYFDYIIEEIEEVTPEEGYVICEFDDFGKMGEKLTILEYVNTEEEAKKIVESNSDKELVYYGKEKE